MDLSFRDWASLPVYILDSVVAKLGPLSDFVRYCAVCSQWRDSALEIDIRRRQYMNILKKSQRKLPMLMITTSDDNKRGLYSVSDRITYNVELPMSYKNRFLGSSHGWLICMEKNLIITLLNPFTNSCISLPPLFGRGFSGDTWKNYVRKVILIGDPLKNRNNYAVLVIYTIMRKLAVYKSGNHCWDYNILPPYGCILSDIIFYKSYIYGVTIDHKLVQVDINTGICRTIINSKWFDIDNFYLVESQEGDLLLVRRVWDSLPYTEEEVEANGPEKTIELKVFKLEHQVDKELGTWVEIDNIGDQILFLGGNCSISISSIEFPEYKRNSIYYTDERAEKYSSYSCQGVDEDNGIYTLEDKKIQSLSDSFQCTQSSIWFVPNPE